MYKKWPSLSEEYFLLSEEYFNCTRDNGTCFIRD